MSRILIINCNEVQCLMLEDQLHETGHITQRFASVEALIRSSENHAIIESADLVILDVVLEKENGIRECGKLRKMPQFMQKPIIVCDELDTSTQFAFWAKENGASAYVRKPLKPKILLRIIESLLLSQDLVRT